MTLRELLDVMWINYRQVRIILKMRSKQFKLIELEVKKEAQR